MISNGIMEALQSKPQNYFIFLFFFTNCTHCISYMQSTVHVNRVMILSQSSGMNFKWAKVVVKHKYI